MCLFQLQSSGRGNNSKTPTSANKRNANDGKVVALEKTLMSPVQFNPSIGHSDFTRSHMQTQTVLFNFLQQIRCN